jgi:hypothetical protein
MSWDAGGGGGEWNYGPATHNTFASQDTRSGFDNFGDAKAANGYGDVTTNGHGDTNGYSDADGGLKGGNYVACFNCGQPGYCLLAPNLCIVTTDSTI